MVLEHMVWLTPRAGVSDDKMEEILASIRALTHIPGVLAISAGKNITDRANSARGCQRTFQCDRTQGAALSAIQSGF